MEWLIGIGLFIATICIIQGIILLFRPKWDPETKTVQKRLNNLTEPTFVDEGMEIRRKRLLSNVPQLHSFLSKIPILARLDRLVTQADAQHPLGLFMLLSFFLFVATFVVMSIFTRGYFLSLVLGIVVASAPFLHLAIKKHTRMRKFERQLPDALDLMARSLKAGHAFSGALQVVAEEFDDPIGTEFLRVVNEINFGGAAEQALRNLTERIDVPDLKFFTVSVIIQRESGGNLAEILESIASLIRERFKLQGRIQALSAEGRLSAIILIALPFFVALLLSIINPKYPSTLSSDPIGRALVMIALLMMTAGIYIIRKMINIKV